jgi:hypothetical protein
MVTRSERGVVNYALAGAKRTRFGVRTIPHVAI